MSLLSLEVSAENVANPERQSANATPEHAIEQEKCPQPPDHRGDIVTRLFGVPDPDEKNRKKGRAAYTAHLRACN